MNAEVKARLQLALGLAIAVAGLRAGYILYERHEENLGAEKAKAAADSGYSNPDYYVVPKKLYPYDLASAKQLTTTPVWTKEGYRYTYYPYSGGHVDFGHEAGLLLPIERLEIKDVITAALPSGGHKQVMATFEKDGKGFAVPIGFENDAQYKIYSDEMFYIEDPHQLYKHWSADTWKSVDQHEVKPGMDELQAVFAIGMGVPDGGGSEEQKTVHYPNGGKPFVIVYVNGKAANIKAGA